MREVDICNLALDNLGVTNKIESMGDTTKEAKACARWYAVIRDLVLRSYPWPFACRIAVLVEDAASANAHPMWDYVYDLPDDFLKARRLVRAGVRNPLAPPPFEIVCDGTGTSYLLATDEPSAILEYTAKFDGDERVPLFPANFVDAFAWKLAARLVLPLAVDASNAERAEKMYVFAVQEAFAVDSVERQADQQPESEFITIRGG